MLSPAYPELVSKLDGFWVSVFVPPSNPLSFGPPRPFHPLPAPPPPFTEPPPRGRATIAAGFFFLLWAPHPPHHPPPSSFFSRSAIPRKLSSPRRSTSGHSPSGVFGFFFLCSSNLLNGRHGGPPPLCLLRFPFVFWVPPTTPFAQFPPPPPFPLSANRVIRRTVSFGTVFFPNFFFFFYWPSLPQLRVLFFLGPLFGDCSCPAKFHVSTLFFFWALFFLLPPPCPQI